MFLRTMEHVIWSHRSEEKSVQFQYINKMHVGVLGRFLPEQFGICEPFTTVFLYKFLPFVMFPSEVSTSYQLPVCFVGDGRVLS